MTSGPTASQLGVTEAMIESYGPFIWEHSNNVQIRRGDPIRRLDFAAIAAEPNGLTDAQMAQALGLSPAQVLQIRVLLEARRYDRHSYNRLHRLGGNRRFRAATPDEQDRAPYRPEALALRAALRHDPALVRRYIEAGWWADDTLSGWLRRTLAGDGGGVAVRSAEAALSWRDLAERVERFAGGLRRLGVRAGDVVAMQLPNQPEFVIAYLAIARLGAVLSTVHLTYRSAEIEGLLRHNQARVFIALSQLKDFAPAAAALALAPGLPCLEHVVALGEAIAGATAYDDVAAAPPLADKAAMGPMPADPFLLLYTSGTTASPKAVPLTYQMTLGNARLAAPEFGLAGDDLILSAAPYSHLLGLFSIHLAMAVGAGNLLLAAFSPAELLATIERDRPTVLFTAPAHFAALATQGLLATADLSSLKVIVMSGSACPPDLVRAVSARLTRGRLIQLWGMTELQAGVYTRPDDPPETAATTTGRPGPGAEIRIADADDRPLPAGQEGELQIRGGLLFAGYFDNEAANRAAFAAEGWFRSGDLAVIDGAGNVRITGRQKEVINRGGVKYNPREIEELLLGHPDVAEVAIVPYPDPVLGEKACCFVVAGPRSPTLAALCAFLAERGVSKQRFPERLELIDEMPLTPTRKVIKARLRERLLATG